MGYLSLFLSPIFPLKSSINNPYKTSLLVDQSLDSSNPLFKIPHFLVLTPLPDFPISKFLLLNSQAQFLLFPFMYFQFLFFPSILLFPSLMSIIYPLSNTAIEFVTRYNVTHFLTNVIYFLTQSHNPPIHAYSCYISPESQTYMRQSGDIHL